MNPFIRSQYNYDMDKVSKETGLECKDKTLAQQQYLEESDINTLVERFGLTGEMPQITQLPSYGDYSGIFDYQTAMNTVVHAQKEFMAMPAKMRARFHNDPQELLDFLDDEENRSEAEKLGLVEKAPDPAQDAPPAPLVAAAAQPGATPQTQSGPK